MADADMATLPVSDGTNNGPRVQRIRIRDWTTPDVDPGADGLVASSALHRWRVFTRRGDEPSPGENHFGRAPVFQQSVTLTAKIWPEEPTADTTEGAGLGSGRAGWASWRVSGEQLPLLVGGVAGGALIIMLVVAAVVWRLCVLRRDKQYRVRMGESGQEPRPVQPVMPSESEVFASPVSGRWAYSSRLLAPDGSSPRGSSTPPTGPRTPLPPTHAPHTPQLAGPCAPQAWVYSCGDPYGDNRSPGPGPASRSRSGSGSARAAVHRSVSLQLAEQTEQSPGHSSRRSPRPRPLSAVSASAGCSPATPRHSAALPPPPPEFLLPQISEFNPGAMGSMTTSGQYASSSMLDDSCASLDDEGLQALRTRSLPSCVRNRQKPLASHEDLDQLYARVNFSKKRKNRMRHDEAAIIAISKSRSQFLDKTGTDTDTLVDNEAVIVYNERTAL